MKMMKRIGAGALSAVLALCSMGNVSLILPADAVDELKDAGLNYTESTEYDLGSCDSGYTSTPWIRAEPGKNWSTAVTRYSLLLIGIGGYSSAMNADGVDYDFDEIFFTSLENTLKSAKQNGATVGIRFRYDDNGTSNPEPADFAQVLRHIEQIGESGLLEKYEEVISFIETGFVGCWGEQWGGKYTSLEHKSQVLSAFMDITPLFIPLVVRTPNIFRQWLKENCGIETTAADMSYSIEDPELAAQAARVGLYNDGYMGSDSDLGTYSNRAGETAWLHTAPAYGGEFSGNDEWRLKYTTWQPEYALPEMYYTNLLRINSNIYRTRTVSSSYATQEEAQTRLDEIDALYEAAGLGDYDYSGTIEQAEDGTYKASWKWMGYDDFIFDETLDEKLGVSCDNSAFYGQTVWQFMRAHLGYRFVLRSSAMSESAGPGEAFTMQFSVENTGFSETPKDKEVEVLLTNGTITYTYATDINARDWASASLHEETLELRLPETMPGGEWKVYLRISEENADAADDALLATRFANAELQYDETLSANYMGSVTVSGEQDTAKAPAEDTRVAGYYMDSDPIAIDEENAVNLLDQTYVYAEDGHYGFTFLYKMEGITEPLQLGNLYAAFTVSTTGYSSAYTTYGLNTRNQELTEDGYYALHVPFYGCAFNCTEASVGGTTKLTALNINDGRNYWSEDTFTELGNNTGVSITPIAFLEGGHEGYEVTFHLPDGDKTYSGTYGFEDKLSQTIRNISVVPALSLLDADCAEQYTDEQGNVHKLLGFTTREGDKSCLIDENFIPAGNVHLYPYYELDRAASDLNQLTHVLVNNADDQGVRYILDDATMTASVGDGSAWENNSGYSAAGSIILPGYVTSGDQTYKVTSIGANAFGSNPSAADVTIPSSITEIGENAFYSGTVLYVYAGSTAADLLKGCANEIRFLEAACVPGDVNQDGCVNVFDLSQMKQIIHSGDSAVSSEKTASDLNGDGQVTAADASILQQYLVGKRPSLSAS
ncbi:MAG: DUF4832 domain-containing protein [Ruminococcus sp.]|nr:DUF4832 domain-containing protein [Ruminococcus sp.]